MTIKENPLLALKQAVELLGGQHGAARALETRQGSVWHWINTQKRVPANLAIKLEKATDGKVTRHQLRPDLYPSEEVS
ncbi:helix-turn-helix domain-containing protein [Agarivorans sp. B2Z047]|uniref:transcriptional regulator n=1 Tax=Agarivorans sp. B2Z047 TaxID=2652721 RepID=UPI002019132B|nr:helix-turn-helix domain-containing protein [Agarivorans sp. B2Z047]UQN41910.1 helix-turn-helix domain-containing protein [Agarivorans sp. B2Z047]